METNSPTEEVQYRQALKRVKRIKGFYSHLMIYILINLMILVFNYTTIKSHDDFWQWQTFSTVIFWGIGLFGHGLSVIIPSVLMGKEWEDKKVEELMRKEKNNRWE